jgi:hypothetical protein
MSAYPDGFAAWSEPQRNAFFASEAKAYDERRREAGALGEPLPIPLCASIAKAGPYPVDALGPLADAARALAAKVQAPLAIAGQSVLAAASLGAQALSDVELPFGQRRPLSIFAITIAASGDRKTTVDNEALSSIRARERELRIDYDAQIAEHCCAKSAWEAQKRKIENDRSLATVDDRKVELAALGPEPAAPLVPILLAPEPTLEGLVKAWVNAPGSLGLFSSEGGQLTGGHGFSPDHRLKTATGLSTLWDGAGVRRMRAGDGLTDLRGRRLAAHIMIQPDAATAFLGDPTLRDQGLLSRLLIAYPESLAGSRFFRGPTPEQDTEIARYQARLLALLRAVSPTSSELEPRAVPLSQAARKVWIAFYDKVEHDLKDDGPLADIRDVAAKAAEQAARIAGVLAVFEDPDVVTIDELVVANACRLVTWHLNEAARLSAVARLDPSIRKAQVLLTWLRARPQGRVVLRDICHSGPHSIRKKSDAEKAISILQEHGWIEVESGKSIAIRVVGES